MASSHKGTADDSLGSLSTDQKGKLLYTLSETPDIFYTILQQWNCQEIRDLLCRESHKDRKYKGLTKDELISILLETILDKKMGEIEERTPPKRQRETLDLSARSKGKGTLYCQNLACQASLIRERYCKRCSCFICHKYDVNKDTSLWLTCDPVEGESCGLSYHLACALESEKSGLKEDNKPSNDLDAIFYCVSCGKPNSSLESWKKQLMAAKEAKKVWDLRNRLVYAQQLLKGTKKYRILSEAAEEAASSLVAGLERSPELRGPLTGIPLSKCKGSITRLGPMVLEVRKRCSAALELFEGLSLPSKELSLDESKVSTKNLQQDEEEASEEEARPFLDFLSVLSNGNNLSTPLQQSAIDTESNSKGKRVSFKTDFVVRQIQIGSSEQRELVTQEAVPENLPINLFTSNQNNDHQDRTENGINMENPGNRSFGFDHCVKIIRQLELSGHIESSFRQKFLTWFSLRATAQEMVVVKTFIETFEDDLAALADQLVDTFTECISRKRSATDGGDGSGTCGAP